jgi:hypothetical protein
MRCCCRSEAGGPLCRTHALQHTELAEWLLTCVHPSVHKRCTAESFQYLQKPAVTRQRISRCRNGRALRAMACNISFRALQAAERPQAKHIQGPKRRGTCTEKRRLKMRMSGEITRWADSVRLARRATGPCGRLYYLGTELSSRSWTCDIMNVQQLRNNTTYAYLLH